MRNVSRLLELLSKKIKVIFKFYLLVKTIAKITLTINKKSEAKERRIEI